jgi:hypothetical protein
MMGNDPNAMEDAKFLSIAAQLWSCERASSREGAPTVSVDGGSIQA